MALLRDFEFAVRYTKGEEKVCVLDRNPWLAKMDCRGESVNLSLVIVQPLSRIIKTLKVGKNIQ